VKLPLSNSEFRCLDVFHIGRMCGSNIYADVGGNPTSYLDLTGKDPFIGAVVGIISGGIYGGLGASAADGSALDAAVAIAVGAAMDCRREQLIQASGSTLWRRSAESPPESQMLRDKCLHKLVR
jgi:hypothetical protein